jgi:hypothetical protein
MLLENGGTSAKPVMNAARRIFICRAAHPIAATTRIA